MPYTDSDPVEGTLSLSGVWIHDPDDPEGSIAQFVYGRSMRTTAIETERSGTTYAGRQFPVYDYGEQESEVHAIRLEVPHGTDWWTKLELLRDFARSTVTLHLRDNRGRAAYGTMTGYREADQDYGTEVAFSWVRVDYDAGDLVTV